MSNLHTNPLSDPFQNIENAFNSIKKYASERNDVLEKATIAHFNVRNALEKAIKENKGDKETLESILKIVLPFTCNGPKNVP
jgi:hypothetical protein